jgi:DNA-binding response OmpR family regulator
MATRLLLAEDTRDLNRALTTVLEHEGYEVVATYDGEEALEHITTEAFDAIILDIMMPKKDGLEVLSEMRHASNFTPVLLLTAKAEVDDRVTGLDAGADDYLSKPFAMKELLARVRSMTRRRDAYGTNHLAFADMTLDAETFELASDNAVRLSVKEFELMQTFMLNPERELSVEYLLDHVWRQEPKEGPDTVSLYVSYLKGKLKWVGSKATIVQKNGNFGLKATE